MAVPKGILRLANAFSAAFSRRENESLEKSLGRDAYEALLDHVRASSANVNTLQIPSDFIEDMLSPSAMLSHPLLVHFIRPATRMARSLGYDVRHIAVISNASLTYAGRAIVLDGFNVSVVEIPLGTVLILRELARVILNLHNAIQYEDHANINTFSRLCRILSNMLYAPAQHAYFVSQQLVNDIKFAYELYAAQAYHVLGAFLILHEMGHIIREHDLDPINEEQSHRQEYEADVFAMECEFAPKMHSRAFESFRELQMIYVCHMFSIFDIGYVDAGIKMDDYPSFSDRRSNLLSRLHASDRVMRAVDLFDRAVRSLPKPNVGLLYT
jgi:hypothetical protein